MRRVLIAIRLQSDCCARFTSSGVMEDYKDGRTTGKYFMNDDLRECWPVNEKTAKTRSDSVVNNPATVESGV